MHVTLTDFRDLARSVMDIGTKRPFWLLGALDLKANHKGST